MKRWVLVHASLSSSHINIQTTVDSRMLFVSIKLNNIAEETDKAALFTSLREETAEGGCTVAGLTLKIQSLKSQ